MMAQLYQELAAKDQELDKFKELSKRPRKHKYLPFPL
jgi:hypothetical protein